MKFFKMLTLALGAVIALTGCSKGVDLGKEVTIKEFETAYAKIDQSPLDKLTSVKIKFDFTSDGNAAGSKKIEYHTDFELTPQTDEKSLGEAEAAAILLIGLVDYEYVKAYWKVLGGELKTYMGSNPTTFGVDASFNAELNTSSAKTTGTYQWNEYGALTYINEAAEAKANDTWSKITTYLTASYTLGK